MFGIKLEIGQEQIQCTHEIIDKEIVAETVMHLMSKGTGPIVYTNESKIAVRKGYKCVHGDLDLLIGHGSDEEKSDHILIVNDQKDYVKEDHIIETKCEGKRLAANRLTKRIDTTLDLSTFIQPVLQTILMGQLASKPRPFLCLYMNRNKVRPLIYFAEYDLLLTTRRSYFWKTNEQLMFRGCLIISVLLRLKDLIEPTQMLRLKLPKTKFVAVTDKKKTTAKRCYYVQATRVQKLQQRISAIEQEKEDTVAENPLNMLAARNMVNLHAS